MSIYSRQTLEIFVCLVKLVPLKVVEASVGPIFNGLVDVLILQILHEITVIPKKTSSFFPLISM